MAPETLPPQPDEEKTIKVADENSEATIKIPKETEGEETAIKKAGQQVDEVFKPKRRQLEEIKKPSTEQVAKALEKHTEEASESIKRDEEETYKELSSLAQKEAPTQIHEETTTMRGAEQAPQPKLDLENMSDIDLQKLAEQVADEKLRRLREEIKAA